MKITEEVRQYAQAKGIDPNAAIGAGLDEKAKEFGEMGGEVYGRGLAKGGVDND
jgi:phosphomethylpyrimidine synthase